MAGRASDSAYRAILAIGLAMAAQASLGASACVVVSEPGSRVQYAGDVVTPPFLAEDCARVSLLRGAAQACFALPGGRSACQAVPAAGAVRAPQAAASEVENGNGLLAAVRGILAGDRQSRIGETRGPGQLAGLPYGELALLDGVLELHFDRATPPLEAQRFRLWRDDQPPTLLLDLDRPKGSLRLAGDKLPRGAGFHWELTTRDWTYDARFSTLDTVALEQSGLQPLAQPADASAAWRGAALQAAVRCEAAGLHADARHLLELAGFPAPAP